MGGWDTGHVMRKGVCMYEGTVLEVKGHRQIRKKDDKRG